MDYKNMTPSSAFYMGFRNSTRVFTLAQQIFPNCFLPVANPDCTKPFLFWFLLISPIQWIFYYHMELALHHSSCLLAVTPIYILSILLQIPVPPQVCSAPHTSAQFAVSFYTLPLIQDLRLQHFTLCDHSFVLLWILWFSNLTLRPLMSVSL